MHLTTEVCLVLETRQCKLNAACNFDLMHSLSLSATLGDFHYDEQKASYQHS